MGITKVPARHERHHESCEHHEHHKSILLLPIYIGSYRFLCRGFGEESDGSEVVTFLSRDGAASCGRMTTGAGWLKVGANDWAGPVPGPGVNAHEIA